MMGQGKSLGKWAWKKYRTNTFDGLKDEAKAKGAKVRRVAHGVGA